MNEPEFSGEPKFSTRSVDDIPEALRDAPNTRTQTHTKLVFLLGGLLLLGAITLGATWYVASKLQKNTASNEVSTAAPSPISTPPAEKVNPPRDSNTLLGHFTYSEAP